MTKIDTNSQQIGENASSSNDEGESNSIVEQGLTNVPDGAGPTWSKDILPTFTPVYIYLVSHLVYFFTGNLMISVWMMFILNPVMNSFSKKGEGETPNVPTHLEKKYTEDKRFLIPLYLYLFIDTLTQFWAFAVVSDIVNIDHPLFENKMGTNFFRWAAFIYVWGYSCGIGGLAGHELIHKKEAVHKLFGTLQFSKFLYGHFLMEHISGHHKSLATVDDPATPQFGENLYAFTVRSAVGGYVNTWARENRRVQNMLRNKQQDPTTSLPKTIVGHITSNKMLQMNVVQALYCVVIYWIFGWKALAFQVVMSIVAIFMGEWINYIEHYGLARNKDKNGVYESITYQHSWNSYSTSLLFRIQRHSDHHAHAYRPYQILRLLEDTPMLPYDYVMSFIISLCPYIWRTVMDPRVEALQAKKKVYDLALDESTSKKVFYYYVIVIVVVSNMVYYS